MCCYITYKTAYTHSLCLSTVCLLQALDQTILFHVWENEVWPYEQSTHKVKYKDFIWVIACLKRRVFTTMSPALPSANYGNFTECFKRAIKCFSLSTKILHFHCRREYQLHNGDYPLVYSNNHQCCLPLPPPPIDIKYLRSSSLTRLP